MRGIKAHAEYDFARDLIHLRIAHRRHDDSWAHASGVTADLIEYTDDVSPGAATEPVLRLTVDEAHAVYDALGVTLNRSHPHADQGRADLLHERDRLDRTLDALIAIAGARQEQR